ncbi:MAG: hypothetical protein WDN69_24500 [Aliidongia sp.]
MANTNPLSRSGEIQLLGHGEEVAEMTQLHRPVFIPLKKTLRNVLGHWLGGTYIAIISLPAEMEPANDFPYHRRKLRLRTSFFGRRVEGGAHCRRDGQG